MNTFAKTGIMAVLLWLPLAAPTAFADEAETVAPTAPDVTQASSDTDQLQQAIKEVEKVMHASGNNFGHGNPENVIIPVVAIFGVFIAPMLFAIGALWLGFRSRDKEQNQKHETIRLMVEKGVEIPAHLSFMESKPASALRRGLILSFLGIGIMCFFLIVNAMEAVGIGAIPLFIGLAYLLIWHLEKKQAQPN